MRQYFSGYYFKCCGEEGSVAFIPALHVDGEERGASLQVITEDRVFTIPYRDIPFMQCSHSGHPVDGCQLYRNYRHRHD